ncbi:MAG: tRNA pseudouridine(38-40) synthase TruA, partial [Gammaproteobacteria bacterium]|nr:tRNA pseudouridine(38-40) synthase TruA [Gammaproteobacteria bacterium]
AALDRNRVWSLREPLAAERMAEAGQALLGEHDFSAFRGAGCQAKSPVRRLDHLRVRRVRDVVQVEIRATGFLYHMVRNIVGGLVRVGTGQAEPGWLLEVLKGRDRSRGAPTAPAQGLYLAEVHYPPALAFPKPPLPAVWRDQ